MKRAGGDEFACEREKETVEIRQREAMDIDRVDSNYADTTTLND